MNLSQRARKIPASVTFVIDARVRELRAQGVDVIGLGAGQPDFPSPPEAVAAARDAIADGQVKYTATMGIPELRAAAAEHVSGVVGVTYSAEQLVVTNGAKEALSLAIAALADAGDEILVPAPAWLSYGPMAQIANVEVRTVPTGPEHDFKLTAAGLSSSVGERTRAVLLNTPGNPTGGVYTADELADLCAVIVERDLTVISDEIYWPFVFGGGKHVSPASLPGMAERTVVINGLSKSYSMTGWRVGFLAAPVELTRAVASLKSHTSSNVAAPSQAAALGALASGTGHIEHLAEAFARRRQLAVDAFATMDGVHLVPPDGAFYVFPMVDAFYDSDLPGSVAFCAQLLEQARVAAVPGEAFGEDRCVRLSIATSDEQLGEGLRRLAGFLTTRGVRRELPASS